jgi:hypothetical protein
MNNINGVIRPRETVSWREFTQHYSQYSIGLDGFITGKPEYQSLAEGGPRANFNHHEDVDRDSTDATCMQVINAIRTGMVDVFSIEGNPRITWYVNDCDEDVCMSTWLLNNLERVIPVQNLLLNKLVGITNQMDKYSGLWPMHIPSEILRVIAWIYNPYRQARLNGTLDQKDPEQYQQIIIDVHNRINEYLAGRGQNIDLNMNFKIIGGGDGWKMIEETGEHARYAFSKHNIDAFISVRQRPNGNYNYTFSRLSKFTDGFPPLTHLFLMLNFALGLTGSPDQFGGGTNTGGNSRGNGCPNPPEEIEKLVNEINAEYKNSRRGIASV